MDMKGESTLAPDARNTTTPEDTVARVYCAGPLFNPPERQEMAAIAAHLEAAGHSTFLPQRDGFELADVARRLVDQGQTAARAADIVQRAIFALDAQQLLTADAVIANLNGRVPDDGTVVEAALAWHAGKALVLYKDDERSGFSGRDNPMITGLTDLTVISQVEQLAVAVEKALADGPAAPVDRVVARGRRIADALTQSPDDAALAALLGEIA
jgi:nucleoside 2-deoxyribosyltransferase